MSSSIKMRYNFVVMGFFFFVFIGVLLSQPVMLLWDCQKSNALVA